MSKPEPFFVVLRLDKDQVPYVDSSYETEKYASLRIKHLAELDGDTAWKHQVVAPYLWQPAPEPRQLEFDFQPPRGIAMTVGRGAELIDYGPRELRRLSLGQVVEGVWDAWRQAQIAAGNLETAALEPPPMPPELFEAHEGTLKLHPQGLP